MYARAAFLRLIKRTGTVSAALGYLGKWRLRGVKRSPTQEAMESSPREPRQERRGSPVDGFHEGFFSDPQIVHSVISFT